jgi:hypothetical protein
MKQIEPSHLHVNELVAMKITAWKRSSVVDVCPPFLESSPSPRWLPLTPARPGHCCIHEEASHNRSVNEAP